jgi:hypothetical protein
VAKTTIGQKPRLNVYTMMLVISFVAITVGCAVLHHELKKWSDPGSSSWMQRWWDTSNVQVKQGATYRAPWTIESLPGRHLG